MSKQTAVEWLLGQISLNGFQAKHIQQAKEIEKQQIIDACNQIEVVGLDNELPGEQYYNETFKN